MKCAAIALAAMLWATVACGAGVSMNGATTADVGETVSIDVEGEPSFDPEKTSGENVEVFSTWFRTLKVLGSWPEGEPPEFEPDVDVAFSFETMNLGWDMRILLTPAVEGTHVVVLEESGNVLLHRIEVGKGKPEDPEDPDDPPPGKVDRATYIYEKDNTSVPPGVAVALGKLNSQGILATEFEQNTLDGDDQVPDQYRLALAVAHEGTLPALIIQSGNVVVKVLRNPLTESEVLEAVDDAN